MEDRIDQMDRTQIINEFYNSISEDTRLEKNRQGQLEYFITMHYIHKFLKPGDRVLEIGAGTGRYSVALAKEGYRVAAVELVESNLRTLRENALGLETIEAYQGDAIDLGRFGDGSFDVTLSFGPMYHLYETEDRHKALDEAIRVTKPGGIILVAFLSAHAIICTNYLYDQRPTALGLKENFDRDYHVRHFKEQLFTGYDIAEFEDLFTNKEVEHITTVAADNVLEVAERRPDFVMTDEDFEAFRDYQLHICEKREMLGNSSHLLYICRKNQRLEIIPEEKFMNTERQLMKCFLPRRISKKRKAQIARIQTYEAMMDEALRLLDAGQNNRELAALMEALEAYYTGADWKRDYADDEAGKLPRDLKRGVLSQDGVYNLLERWKELLEPTENGTPT